MTNIISILSELVPGKKIEGSTDSEGVMWFELAPLTASLGMRADNATERLISDDNAKTIMGTSSDGFAVPRIYVSIKGIIEILLNSRSSTIALARARVVDYLLDLATGSAPRSRRGTACPNLPAEQEAAITISPLVRAERVADHYCWVGALLLDSSTASRVQKATVEVQLAADHEVNVTKKATRLMRALWAHFGQATFSAAAIEDINDKHNNFLINEPDPRAEIAEAYKHLKAGMTRAGVKASAMKPPHVTARILDALAVGKAFNLTEEGEGDAVQLVIVERRHSKRVVCIREASQPKLAATAVASE